MGQIQKIMQTIMLDDKYSLISMIMSHYFMIRPTLEARAEIQNYFRWFFGSNEKFALEIN